MSDPLARIEPVVLACLLACAGAAAAVTIVSQWVEDRIEALCNLVEPM